MKTSVLIADDHQIFRDGLRGLLQGESDIEILGEAGDGRSIVNLSRRLRPDLVIMDITMPRQSGIEATEEILARNPAIKVLALSMHSDRRFVNRALEAGASGYLLKDCAFEELTRAIHTVVSGQIYLSPRMLEAVSSGPGQGPGAADAVLTQRETEVLRHVAVGRTTARIARQLGVSVKTVETHRKHIMDKLDLHSVAQLTKYAVREGLTPVDA